MKSSNLLKPNKITFSHQSKINPQNKPKSSSRYSSSLLQKSSINDPFMDKNPSKKNVIGKQNQQRNIQSKQTKRQSNPKLKKASQMYMNQKMNRLNKVYRNQSMHMIRDQNFDDIEPFSRLNNSSINQKQNINKKKKVSKPILDNLPSNQQNNSLMLNRSSFSDKMIQVKEKKCQNNNVHFQSCKNLQPTKNMQQSKSIKVLQKRTSTANKPGIYLVKNNPLPSQNSQSQRNSVTDLINKNQNKSKNHLVSKQVKTQQTSRKIKRTKLGWLILVNNLYTLVSQKPKKLSNEKKSPSLFDWVHYLKNYEKKYHSQQQLFTKQQIMDQFSQKVSLAQLLKYFKIILNRDEVYLPYLVWKEGSRQIDSQKTQISFNSFGRIIFSHQSIIQELEKEQNKNKLLKNNQKSLKNSQNQQQQIKTYSGAVKQEDDIVQTARFQNHHENSSSPYYSHKQQQIQIDKKIKKKNLMFTKDDQQLIYQQGIGNLISKKLTKDKGENKKTPINLNINQKCFTKIDKNLSKIQNNPKEKNPSKIERNIGKKDSFLLEKRDEQRSRVKVLQSSNGDWKSNMSMNKQHSRSSLQDISQIMQANQSEKLMITSFNAKYNSKRESSLIDPFQYQQLTDKQLLFRNSNGMSEGYNSNCIGSDQLALQSCRLQALNMNSSQLFLQSVILSNLYHTNFNISFSDQPLQNSSQLFNTYKNMSQKLNYSKLQDIVQQIQNILMSMKNLFSFDQDSLNNDNRLIFKSLNKQSIKIQDLTQMQDFLSQFIDYKVFRQDKKLNTDQQYFNAVKLTQSYLTSLQTKKASANVVKSSLITKYFSYFQAIRINQGPFLVENIESLIGSSNRIKILNLADNQLNNLQGIIKVVENNMESLEFLNLSNNCITSLKLLFDILGTGNDRKKCFSQLRQVHLKNNKITQLGYRKQQSQGLLKEKRSKNNNRNDTSQNNNRNDTSQNNNRYDFPKLQLLDLRLNMIGNDEKQSIQLIILQSPQLSIMSLKMNPIMEGNIIKQISRLLSERSIYEYDSLQMMSAYIKYKDITFTDSNQGCCSLVELDNIQPIDEDNKLINMNNQDLTVNYSQQKYQLNLFDLQKGRKRAKPILNQ